MFFSVFQTSLTSKNTELKESEQSVNQLRDDLERLREENKKIKEAANAAEGRAEEAESKVAGAMEAAEKFKADCDAMQVRELCLEGCEGGGRNGL